MRFYLSKMNAVFYHVPKTGGKSIRCSTKSSPVEFGEIPADWPIGRSFAFVREPLDRLFSGFHYLRQEYGHACLRSIRSAVEIAQDKSVPLIDKPGDWADVCWLKHHLLCQSDPYYRIDEVQNIGRFENLQQDFDSISDCLGVEKRVLPHFNKTPRPRLNALSKDIEFALDYLMLDYERFGYPIPKW